MMKRRVVFILCFLFSLIHTSTGQQNPKDVLEAFVVRMNAVTNPKREDVDQQRAKDNLYKLFSEKEKVRVFDFYQYQLEEMETGYFSPRHSIESAEDPFLRFMSRTSFYKKSEFELDLANARYLDSTSIGSATSSNFKVNVVLRVTSFVYKGEPQNIREKKQKMSMTFFLTTKRDEYGMFNYCRIDRIKYNNREENKDQDNFMDGEDSCRSEFGSIDGCPDSDNDGIADKDDECPYEPGYYPYTVNGCPDSDADGLIDLRDSCKTDWGVAYCDGCPDTDEDGICDGEDECPSEKGTPDCNGCPDLDEDGICDNEMEEDWETAKETNSVKEYEFFQRNYANGAYFWEADSLIRGLVNKPVRADNSSMRFVSGGVFEMGCPEEISECVCVNNNPAHHVQLASFYMDPYEITNRKYADFLNEYDGIYVKNGVYADELMIQILDSKIWKDNGQWLVEDTYAHQPVVGVTWYGANEYARYYGLRLPTEAEWEYAARGGQNQSSDFYSGSNQLKEVSWYIDNSGGKVHEVGTKAPNSLHLYDMTGNVYEWCGDLFAKDYYESEIKDTVVNPLGPRKERGHSRIIRGGAWDTNQNQSYIFYRKIGNPKFGSKNIGFRCVKEIPR
jgi:sulfatase modifying factor 1